jgi:predicted negative regulator of RcsB-dependent stress response
MYQLDKRYPLAQQYFQDALDELSFIQKHLGNQSMKHMIQLGIANALFGQDKVTEANQKLETILKEVKNEAEKSFIESQYAGNI